ncbi:MAG: c-type cytochrome [Mangrovicoccus sp.]
MITLLRAVLAFCLLALVGLAVAWFVTKPGKLDPEFRAELRSAQADVTAGEKVFWAAGCASCHSAPEASGDAKLLLIGGQRFASDFGTFLAPNITPDPDHGIGSWSLENLALALKQGVSPGGTHYYPAFPYNSYTHMTAQDVADLKAFLDSLPADTTANQPHELGFPFNIHRSLGGWKLLFFRDDWVMTDAEGELVRGRYLVEALGHCGECHTPRNPLGGLQKSRWLAGAPNPNGEGKIPNITPAELDWAEADIAYYLESGFTPEFDAVGGHMAPVVENFAKLPAEDRAAVAAYLKAIPAAN